VVKYGESRPLRHDYMATLGIDVEDWYHAENLQGICPRTVWPQCESRVERNVDRLLTILEETGTTATFFILGEVAKRFPSTVVRKIAKGGHELGSHGYSHRPLYSLSDEVFRADAQRSKSLIEDVSGQAVLGYRAPNFSIRASVLPILGELGYVYDSSLNPVRISSRYGKLEWHTPVAVGHILRFDSIYEIHMSRHRVLGLSVPLSGGGYFRLCPYFIWRCGVKAILASRRFYNFYLHPWEIDRDVPRFKGLRFDLRFRHYHNLHKTEARLRWLLRDISFVPLCRALPSTVPGGHDREVRYSR
jgi:polysaccharide deacetylase family protein (PEP-CTERM system associated)